MDGGQPPQGMQGMNSGFNVMPQVPMVVQMQSSNPQQQLMVMQQDLAPLDYEKIKSFLVNSNEKIKSLLVNSNEEIKVCATLQALRWRLTKTKRK